MKFKFWTKIIMALIVLTLIGGCIFLPQKPGYVRILVYSGEPNSPSSVVSSMDTLFVGIDGLKAFERYDIEIQDSANKTMAKFALNATAEGKLPPTAMWPDAGLLPQDDGPADPNSDIQIGSYKVILTGPETNVTFPFSVITRTTPVIWSSNNTSLVTNGYLEGEEVWVAGMGFVAGATVDIYTMRDRDSWNNGEFLNDLYVDKDTATVGLDGKLLVDLGVATIQVGANGDCPNFDIIVDANRNGILDPKDAVDSKNAAGYTVFYNPDAHGKTVQDYLKLQLASNGRALDYTTHWNDTFYYPDLFNQDGSDTGFWWEGFGKGVFCILNPLIDETDPATGLVPWQMVQIWVVRQTDFDSLAYPYDLTGLDVSDSEGRPDLVWVQQTCSNGAGSILIWQAPLVDRRQVEHPPVAANDGFVVVVEKPDASGAFDNKYDPASDYIDGDLNVVETPGDSRGFSVVQIMAQ